MKNEASNTVRPCYVVIIHNPRDGITKTVKGLFHGFATERCGDYTQTKAIIEMPDGSLTYVEPIYICFADTKQIMSEFNWNE